MSYDHRPPRPEAFNLPAHLIPQITPQTLDPDARPQNRRPYAPQNSWTGYPSPNYQQEHGDEPPRQPRMATAQNVPAPQHPPRAQNQPNPQNLHLRPGYVYPPAAHEPHHLGYAPQGDWNPNRQAGRAGAGGHNNLAYSDNLPSPSSYGPVPHSQPGPHHPRQANQNAGYGAASHDPAGRPTQGYPGYHSAPPPPPPPSAHLNGQTAHGPGGPGRYDGASAPANTYQPVNLASDYAGRTGSALDLAPTQPVPRIQTSGLGHHGPPRRRAPGVATNLEPRRAVTSPTMPTISSENALSSFPASQAPGQQPFSRQEESREARTKSLSLTSLRQSGSSANQRSVSSGSTHTFSLTSKSRSFSSLGKLGSLSSKKFSSSASLQKADRSVSTSTLVSQKLAVLKQPTVYPAVLSRVARAFKDSVVIAINMKDGLEYHDTFTGKQAVDVICNIIRTNDRNLALLLGRSLDAQKFFHDVAYNHRLRDSNNEVYMFTRVFNDLDLFADDGNTSTPNRGSLVNNLVQTSSTPYPVSPIPSSPIEAITGSFASLSKVDAVPPTQDSSGVNGVFTILTDCYSPTCSRNRLCYSIACPRRLEQQARLNMKPRGGLKRAVSRLSLHDNDSNKTLWHETVDLSILDKLDKQEKMRQELIYELIYTERDYVKDLEFMTDFYIMPLRNPANNIIPEREREAFIRTVFGGVSDLLRLAKSLSEALTLRQQQQKPVVDSVGDVLLQYVGNFDPFIKYSGNKVFASFEHERQQQVNMKYARFLEAIEKKPESRKQDLSSFLIKGVQRPARYQLLLSGILKNTKELSDDYKNLVKAKEEIEKVLVKINHQTGESTDRHKIMVLHRLLGRQTLEERYNFKLSYNHRIIYQVTLSRKRDNEKIDVYLFEHALLMVKHKIQNKREVYKVFEKPIYLPLLYVNSGYDSPTFKTILSHRESYSIVSDGIAKLRPDVSQYNPVSSSQQKLQLNFLGLGTSPVHVSLFADDVTNQSQVLLQIQMQQKKWIEKHDIFSLSKYETRRFTGNNLINCAVPCYGGKKLLYGTDSGVWVSTVRSISMTSNEKICSDPTMVISKPYVAQMEVLVEYSKLLVLSDKTLYEFDLSCTDSPDHVRNTRSGKVILSHVSSFKSGVCDGKLLVCAIKSGSTRSISIVEPTNPFDRSNKSRNRRPEVQEITFSSDPVSISFLKTKLCIGCTRGFEILSLAAGEREPILDEADPSLDFATQRESVTPLAIHRLDKNFLLSYSEFSFLINRNGWRTRHDWGIYWEGQPKNIALFYPYLLAFEPGYIEIRDLESTTLIRALVGENIRFLHSNEHEALYACEDNGYDIIVSIDFLNLKPRG